MIKSKTSHPFSEMLYLTTHTGIFVGMLLTRAGETFCGSATTRHDEGKGFDQQNK
jgi:hypothetical protein